MSLSVSEIKNSLNYDHLSPEQKELVNDGFIIMETLEARGLSTISDYSFLVAPFAKAYEGFLKKFFLERRLVSSDEYGSDRFSVGKVLNPNLKNRSFSLYSRLEKIDVKRTGLADFLWNTWKEGRNLIFHYFPQNLNRVDLPEARERVGQIIAAINLASRFLDKKELIEDNDKT